MGILARAAPLIATLVFALGLPLAAPKAQYPSAQALMAEPWAPYAWQDAYQAGRTCAARTSLYMGIRAPQPGDPAVVVTTRGFVPYTYRKGESFDDACRRFGEGSTLVARKKPQTQVAARKAPVKEQIVKLPAVPAAAASMAAAIGSRSPASGTRVTTEAATVTSAAAPTAPVGSAPLPPQGGTKVVTITTAPPADTAVRGEINALEQGLATAKQDLAATTLNLASAHERIGELSDRLAKAEADMAALMRSAERAAAALAAATTRTEALTARLETAEAALETANTRNEELLARLETTDAALAATTARTDNLAARLETAEATIGQHGTAFASFGPRVSGIETGIATIQAMLAENAKRPLTNTMTLAAIYDRVHPLVFVLAGLMLLAVVLAILAFAQRVARTRTTPVPAPVAGAPAVEPPVVRPRAATAREKSVRVERGMVIPFQLAEECVIERGAFGTSFDIVVTGEERRAAHLSPVGSTAPPGSTSHKGYAPWDMGFTTEVDPIDVAVVTGDRVEYRTQRLTKMIAEAVRGDDSAQSERIRRWLVARELVIDPGSRTIVEHRRPDYALAA